MGTHPIFESDFDCLTWGIERTSWTPNRSRKLTRSSPLLSTTPRRAPRPRSDTSSLSVLASRLPVKPPRALHRQEVPLHRQRHHPWPSLHWSRPKDEDAANHHHPTGLPSLCQEVRSIRETTHQHGCPPLSLLPGRRARRYCDCWRVPTSLQDCPIQRRQAHQAPRSCQEAIRQVLSAL